MKPNRLIGAGIFLTAAIVFTIATYFVFFAERQLLQIAWLWEESQASSTVNGLATAVDGYWANAVDVSAERVRASRPVQLMIFGDVMLDRSVRLAIDAKGIEWVFAHVRSWIESADFAIVNAEGSFTENKSIALRDRSILRFTFATTTLPVLRALGFDAFSQANNHTADFGRAGLNYSREKISEHGIVPFGDFYNEQPGPEYLTYGSTTIALIAFNEFAYKNTEKVGAAITEARQYLPNHDAYVIVMPHWGVEYVHEPSKYQIKMAHAFIDAGADAVIGAHPHVVQSVELYKDRPIFYSLGNFVFDQAFSADVKEGYGLSILVASSSVSYTVKPFNIIATQPIPMGATTTAAFMDRLIGYSKKYGVSASDWMGETMTIFRDSR